MSTVRVLNARGVAFITYSNEANGQFAKEAMAHQSLNHNEILNVRWATVDPNPMAQAREARKIEEQAAEAVRRALPAEFVAEIEGKDPEARKRKRIEGTFGLAGYEPPDAIWYARTVVPTSSGGGGSVAHGATNSTISPNHAQPQIAPPPTAATIDPPTGDGILSTSTLAAIKGFSVHVGGDRPPSDSTNHQSSASYISVNPLVSYDSNDDETD